MIVRGLKAVDRRAGSTHPVRFAMRYVFPDHWSFMWGEIALYCFVVLVATGVYLTFWFDPSRHQVVYDGSYGPLRGAECPEAYRSTVDLSLDNPFGLLMRQTHHWAALVFLAAIVMHLMRIFFTGAFRRPRELNWLIGLVMLMAHCSRASPATPCPTTCRQAWGLPSPTPSRSRSRCSVARSATCCGTARSQAARLREPALHRTRAADPGADRRADRVHLAFVVMLRHTQFRGPRRTEQNVVGTPLWPGYGLRSVALFFGVTAVLLLLGGLVQINPIWQYGPYEPALATNGAQPDWYLGG